MAERFDIGDLGRHFSRLTPEEKAIRLAAFFEDWWWIGWIPIFALIAEDV